MQDTETPLRLEWRFVFVGWRFVFCGRVAENRAAAGFQEVPNLRACGGDIPAGNGLRGDGAKTALASLDSWL